MKKEKLKTRYFTWNDISMLSIAIDDMILQNPSKAKEWKDLKRKVLDGRNTKL